MSLNYKFKQEKYLYDNKDVHLSNKESLRLANKDYDIAMLYYKSLGEANSNSPLYIDLQKELDKLKDFIDNTVMIMKESNGIVLTDKYTFNKIHYAISENNEQVLQDMLDRINNEHNIVGGYYIEMYETYGPDHKPVIRLDKELAKLEKYQDYIIKKLKLLKYN